MTDKGFHHSRRAGLPLALLISDERLRPLRFGFMPAIISDYLTPPLTHQISHWRRPRHEIVHRKSVNVPSFVPQYSDPAEEFASALKRGYAS